VLSCLTDDEPGVRGDRERLAELRRRRTQDALEYFQRHAHDWDRLRSLYVSESRVEAAVLDAIGDAPCDTLLDIGTGTGRMLQLLAPRAETAIGIDSSAAMLAAARPTFEQPTLRHVQLRHGDMYRLPIADASIDRVIIHQVLHFADDPERVAREIARVLRPGGRALVVDFAPHALEFLRTDHAHRRLGFSTDEVAGWGTRAGLTVREVTRLSGAPLTVVLWEAAKGHTDHPA
jgi:ubiquinone/menaquinone biosynthesis C-methylase UbiE